MKTKDKAMAVLLVLVVWGLAGGLFGSLFAGIFDILKLMGLSGWQPLVIGAAAAAMTTSAFYGAMPVALVGAMSGVIASLIYLMVSGQRIELVAIMLTAGITGLLIGGFYAWMEAGGERSLGETITGFLAGIVAGVLLWLGLALYGEEVGMFVRAAAVVALVGTLFKLNERWVSARLARHVPRPLSASVVAAAIAAVVGAGAWLVGGAASEFTYYSGSHGVASLVADIPSGFLGGMLGGAVTGVLLELLGMHLEEDEHAA